MKREMDTLPGRLAATGVSLFGSSWRRRLADGIGISRGTLWNIMSGPRKRGAQTDIDGALIALVERERDACAQRSIVLGQLRNKLIAATDK